MNKIRTFAQAIGYLALALLALYGVLTLLGGASPLPLALQAHAQELVTASETASGPDAAIPGTINYQGYVRDSTGKLLNGTYDITARIWDSAIDGNEKYKNDMVKGVSVRDGLFNIVLGEKPAFKADTFDPLPRYIGIDLGQGELIPRQRLHAVPWAMAANKAKSADAATTAATATTLVDNASIKSFTSTGNASITGNATISGNATVSGDLNTKRAYASYTLEATYTDQSKYLELGAWDFCALAGVQLAGLDNYAPDWGKCLVFPDIPCWDWMNCPGPEPRYVRAPGDRPLWYFMARVNAGSDQALCKATCFNLGQRVAP